FRLAGLQFLIGADDVFKRRKKQVENLLLVGGDGQRPTLENHISPCSFFAVASAGFPVEDGANAREQVIGVVRLGDEVSGAAFQSLDDISRVWKRCDENDRNFAFAAVIVDLSAESIAGHSGKNDIGYDKIETGR